MAKSLSQEAFEIKHANEMELAKRELTRRALDTIRIYNPLDHMFAFMYDRYWHRVPAHATKDVDRYLAVHFFKKICDFMIGQQIMLKGEELKALREKQMGKQFLDKYEENVQIWDRQPKLNDPDLIEQIKSVVLLGVVEEYGMDEPEAEEQVAEKPMDFRPLHEQIFSSIDKVVATETVAKQYTPESPVKPIEEILDPKPETKKKELEKEIIAQA